MNVPQNCVYPTCLAKGSLKKVFTIQYYKKKTKTHDFTGGKVEKPYETHKDAAVFYICEKCGFMSNFKNNDMRAVGTYWLFLVPKNDEYLLQKTKTKGLKGCIYCGSRIYPPKYVENHLTKNAIIKLFVSPNREYLGYHCIICRRTYAIKPSSMTWENTQSQFKDAESVNVLDQQHVYFNENELRSLIHFDENRDLVISKIHFKKVGGIHPMEGADFGEPNIEMHTISFPKSKVKRLLKMLEKRGCKIDSY